MVSIIQQLESECQAAYSQGQNDKPDELLTAELHTLSSQSDQLKQERKSLKDLQTQLKQKESSTGYAQEVLKYNALQAKADAKLQEQHTKYKSCKAN